MGSCGVEFLGGGEAQEHEAFLTGLTPFSLEGRSGCSAWLSRHARLSEGLLPPPIRKGLASGQTGSHPAAGLGSGLLPQVHSS